MQPVGADQQLTRDLHSMAVAALHERRDAVGVLAVAGDTRAGVDGIRAEALDRRLEKQHLQSPRCTAYCGHW